MLGLALTVLAVVVMLVIAVHLIESVWQGLVVIVAALGGLAVAGLAVRRWWDNRYR